MAAHKLYNASVTINSVDLSDHCKSVTINQGAESLDNTVMSNTTRSHLGGLFTWSIDIEFEQDYASSSIDQTLNALVGATTTFIIKSDAGTTTATNPKWTGTGLVTSYQPVGGTVGDLHLTKLHLDSASVLTRGTS